MRMELLEVMCKFFKSNIILFPILLGLGFSSCERDEVSPVKPLEFDSTCDTNYVSFLQTIKPTINKNCEYCHNNSYTASGVNLEGYDNIKKSAANGTLKKSINGSMKVYIENDCDNVKIQAWINQGSKNN